MTKTTKQLRRLKPKPRAQQHRELGNYTGTGGKYKDKSRRAPKVGDVVETPAKVYRPGLAPSMTPPDRPSRTKTVEQPAVTSALATVTAPAPDAAQLTMYLQTSTELAAKVSLLTVRDEATNVAATDMLLQLKSAEKDLKAKRDAVVVPIKKHAEFLDSLFKPGFVRLQSADVALRAKVLAYRADAQRAADKERIELTQKAADAAAEGDNETALMHATAAVSVDEPSRLVKGSAGIETTAPNVSRGQVAVRDVTDFEVVDLGAIPHEYFSFDSAKVRSAMRSGVENIPGLRIFKRPQLAVGGR